MGKSVEDVCVEIAGSIQRKKNNFGFVASPGPHGPFALLAGSARCERYEGGYIVQMGISRERIIQTRDEINEMLAHEEKQIANTDICIQWKGTTVCGDFHCECGAYAHICDAMHMYQIKCAACGVVWHVPDRIVLVRTSNVEADAGTVIARPEPEEV